MKKLYLALASFFLVASIISDVDAEKMYYRVGTDLYKKENIDPGLGVSISAVGSNNSSFAIDQTGEYIYTSSSTGQIIKVSTDTGAIEVWESGNTTSQAIGYIG